MLNITRVATTDGLATHAMGGEITVDQAERIEALCHAAVLWNRGVTIDLRHRRG